MKLGKYFIEHGGNSYVEYGFTDQRALAAWAKKKGLDAVPKGVGAVCVAPPIITAEELEELDAQDAARATRKGRRRKPEADAAGEQPTGKKPKAGTAAGEKAAAEK